MLMRDRGAEPARARLAQRVADLVQVGLPEHGSDQHDREPDLQREPCGTGHRVKCACRRRTAATTSSTSESECAGESGSESTSAPAVSATGSGAGRVRRAEVREVVHRQEVQARADALLAQCLRVGIAVGAGLLTCDAHDVEVPAVDARGPEAAPERRDAGQAGEALVVALGLREAPRAVLVDPVQLAERHAGVQIAQVELVAGLEHVVGARSLLLVALPRVAREPVQAQRGDARRERLVAQREHAAFARGEVLVGVEAEAGDVADGADLAAVGEPGLGRVRGILHQLAGRARRRCPRVRRGRTDARRSARA